MHTDGFVIKNVLKFVQFETCVHHHVIIILVAIAMTFPFKITWFVCVATDLQEK